MQKFFPRCSIWPGAAQSKFVRFPTFLVGIFRKGGIWIILASGYADRNSCAVTLELEISLRASQIITLFVTIVLINNGRSSVSAFKGNESTTRKAMAVKKVRLPTEREQRRRREKTQQGWSLMHSNSMVRETGRQKFRNNSPLWVYRLHPKSVRLMPYLYAKMSKPWGKLIFTLELLNSNQQLHTEILSDGQQCPGHSEGKQEFRALDLVKN